MILLHSIFRVFAIFILGGLSSLAASAAMETETERRAIEKAHVAVDEIQKDFFQALQAAQAKGDLKKALPGCRVKNLRPEEMKVGRTSHRLRNPNNAPPEWTKAYLEDFAKMSPGKIPKYALKKLGPHRYGYIEPIFVQPVCLSCHGPSVTSEVKEAIRAVYPNDQALNFKAGDFRGLLWLEIKDE